MSAILVPTLAGLGSGTVTLTGIGAVLVKILKGIAVDAVRDGTADIRQDVTDLKVKFASETGGNSNGLRQAVNELSSEVSDVKADVAFLKGVHDASKVAAA